MGAANRETAKMDHGQKKDSGQKTGSGALNGLAAAIVVSAGLAAAGAFLADGIVRNRTAERTVTVRGLAEREVMADLAIWPMSVTAAGDDLVAVQGDIDVATEKTRAFLLARGFSDEEIALGRVNLQDRLAQSWGSERPAGGRYLINQPIRVRTEKVDLVDRTTRETGALLRAGVVLTGYEGPSFVFTRLNDIKPVMLEEATRNARDAADAFARDSGAKVGAIRNAQQGLFQILPRDDVPGETEASQIAKNVRVVTSVTYLLDE